MHPLGKSPVITDGDVRIAESAAIVDYVIRRYGQGRMMPKPECAWISRPTIEWLHYSEGSAMLPLMLHLYVGRLKEAGAPLHPRIDCEIGQSPRICRAGAEGARLLRRRGSLTGADIQMSFVAEMAKGFDRLGPYPALARAGSAGCTPGRRSGAASRRAGPTVWRD